MAFGSSHRSRQGRRPFRIRPRGLGHTAYRRPFRNTAWLETASKGRSFECDRSQELARHGSGDSPFSSPYRERAPASPPISSRHDGRSARATRSREKYLTFERCREGLLPFCCTKVSGGK